MDNFSTSQTLIPLDIQRKGPQLLSSNIQNAVEPNSSIRVEYFTEDDWQIGEGYSLVKETGLTSTNVLIQVVETYSNDQIYSNQTSIVITPDGHIRLTSSYIFTGKILILT